MPRDDAAAPLAAGFSRVLGWRGYLYRGSLGWLAPIGVRMGLLILISAVPMLLMAGDIAWRAYQDRAGAMIDRASSARDEAVGRAEANLETARQLLATLSQAAPVQDPGLRGCHELMVQIEQIRSDPFISFGVVDQNGNLLCSSLHSDLELKSAPLVMAKRAWFQRVSQTRQFALGEAMMGRVLRTQLIVVGSPVMQNGRMWRIVYAGLRESAFASPGQQLSAWVLAAANEMPVQGVDAALPGPDLLAAVRASAGRMTFTGVGRDGRNYAYASAALSSDAHLLLAYPEQRTFARKLQAMAWRIAVLGLLLLAGVAMVAAGAIVLVARPLQLLRNEVRDYTPGRPFAPSGLKLASVEVQQLSEAFAAATRRLAEHEARQELLISEIHHRVKNNLQIVASLLNLQAARLRQPEARAEFQIARDRVQALATLHRHLTSQGDGSFVAMNEFLGELVRQMFSAMGEKVGREKVGGEKVGGEKVGGEEDAGRIGLVIDANLSLPVDQAVPVGLIVTEAVSNALKYAFPDGAAGTIRVTLDRQDDAIRLEVVDDGVGWNAEEAGGEGLGLRLIRGFARQLGGNLTIVGTHGVSFMVEGIEGLH